MKKLIFLMIISTFSFAQSHQEAYCKSEALSQSMPEVAGKMVDRSRALAEEEFHNREEFISKTRKSTRRKIRNFEYVELCLDKDTQTDLDYTLTYKLKRKEYLDQVKIPNPIKECLSKVAPEHYWEELRRKQTKKLCEGLKASISTLGRRVGGLDCDISDLGIIDFKYVKELQEIRAEKKQCILYLRQVKDVVDTLKSK
jgi:hypothetical protein